MKKYLSTLCLTLCFAFGFSAHALKIDQSEDKKPGIMFQVNEQQYRFSTVFELNSQNMFFGTVRKPSLSVRTHYELYDATGQYEGEGICRFFTLGSVYTWGTEIDIYDEHGNKVGLIDGQMATTAAAKFSIYNSEGDRVGIAYLDKSSGTFAITDPENEQHYLVSLKRNFIPEVIDNWDVIVFNPDAIDMRILKIFSAFAVDTQGDFKKDN